MSNSLIMGYGTTLSGFTSTSTDFFFFTGMLAQTQAINNLFSTTAGENAVQSRFQGGKTSNLWCRVKTGTTVGASTVTLRINGVNKTQTISISQGATGAFTDSSDTDNTSDGDLLSIGVTPGDTNLILNIMALTFTPSSNTVTRLGSACTTTIAFSTGSTVNMEQSGASDNSTEAHAQSIHKKSMTVKNLQCWAVNTATSSVNIISRRNTANGNLSVSISSSTGTAGVVGSDTSHSDSIVLNDLYNYQYTNPATGVLQPTIQSTDFISSVGDSIFSANPNTLTGTAHTGYVGLSGSITNGTVTETQAQVLINSAFTFSQLVVSVITNSVSAASTLNLRANAGNTGISASITANTTGTFVDSSNTYTASPTDLMNYQIVTGSTGTSINITQESVWANITSVAAGGPSYQHFDTTFKAPTRRQIYNPFGGQMIIFG